jgi:DNA-binding GntR family transcriptional regulator
MDHTHGLSSMESGLAELAPVRRDTVQARIYRQLRDGLIRGAFDAGEEFRIQDLAARLGVSTMPVREALARLVSEGALETMPSRTVRVPTLTLERARDIVAARSLIEGDLLARAVPRLAPGDLEALEALTARYEAASGLKAVAELNHRFHFLLYARSGSAVLLPFVESLWMQAGPYIRAAARLHSPLIDPAATLHHRAMIAAARAGDAAAATEALRADVGRVCAILERAGPAISEAR